MSKFGLVYIDNAVPEYLSSPVGENLCVMAESFAVSIENQKQQLTMFHVHTKPFKVSSTNRSLNDNGSYSSVCSIRQTQGQGIFLASLTENCLAYTSFSDPSSLMNASLTLITEILQPRALASSRNGIFILNDYFLSFLPVTNNIPLCNCIKTCSKLPKTQGCYTDLVATSENVFIINSVGGLFYFSTKTEEFIEIHIDFTESQPFCYPQGICLKEEKEEEIHLLIADSGNQRIVPVVLPKSCLTKGMIILDEIIELQTKPLKIQMIGPQNAILCTTNDEITSSDVKILQKFIDDEIQEIENIFASDEKKGEEKLYQLIMKYMEPILTSPSEPNWHKREEINTLCRWIKDLNTLPRWGNSTRLCLTKLLNLSMDEGETNEPGVLNGDFSKNLDMIDQSPQAGIHGDSLTNGFIVAVNVTDHTAQYAHRAQNTRYGVIRGSVLGEVDKKVVTLWGEVWVKASLSPNWDSRGMFVVPSESTGGAKIIPYRDLYNLTEPIIATCIIKNDSLCRFKEMFRAKLLPLQNHEVSSLCSIQREFNLEPMSVNELLTSYKDYLSKINFEIVYPNSVLEPFKVKNIGVSAGSFFRVQNDSSNWLGKLPSLGYATAFGERPYSNLQCLTEKIIADLFYIFSRDKYIVPETLLANLPIDDGFTRKHHVSLYPDKKFHLRVMSKIIPQLILFQKAKTLDEAGEIVSFSIFVATYNKPPEFILTDNHQQVPLLGIMELICVMKVLGDIDGFGSSCENAGFIWVKNSQGVVEYAQTVAIDFGEALQLHRTKIPDEGKNIQTTIDLYAGMYCNRYSSTLEIRWDCLADHQKDVFLETLTYCSRFANCEVMRYIFQRRNGNQFSSQTQALCLSLLYRMWSLESLYFPDYKYRISRVKKSAKK